MSPFFTYVPSGKIMMMEVCPSIRQNTFALSAASTLPAPPRRPRTCRA